MQYARNHVNNMVSKKNNIKHIITRMTVDISWLYKYHNRCGPECITILSSILSCVCSLILRINVWQLFYESDDENTNVKAIIILRPLNLIASTQNSETGVNWSEIGQFGVKHALQQAKTYNYG